MKSKRVPKDRCFYFSVDAMELTGNVFASSKAKAICNVQVLLKEKYNERVPASDIKVWGQSLYG